MIKRVLLVAAVAIVLAAGAVLVMAQQGTEEAEHGPGTSMDAMSRSIGSEVMLHVTRGHYPGRSAEVYLVPKPHHYFAGDVDLTTLGTDTPWTATAHPSPWRYTARVPLIFYGPKLIDPGQEIYDPVDIAAVAPTYAEVLGVEELEAEADALPEIVGSAAGTKPKVIFSVVLDGGGWNTLQEHPDSWPTIRKLAQEGTSYVNADIGSAPSITGALHATFGTGVYPRTHGLPGNQMRSPDGGENIDTWLEEADGRYLESVTVSELWDEQNDNKPLVGTVSYEGWHLGMIGQGALREGGDRDVAALWDHVENTWWTNEEYYELPKSLEVTDVERLESYEESLDPEDGLKDGLWFDNTLEELREEPIRPGTPAFTRFTGDATIDTMRDVKLGSDDITDMFWVEMKMPDFAGHIWNMIEPEEAAVLRETDAQVARFKAELDRTVGEGNYIIMISADHGQQPFPDLLGGWRINTQEFQKDVEAEFGNVVEKVTTTDIFMDLDAVEEEGITLEEVAEWASGYTIGENIGVERPGADRVPESRLDDLIFAGAFSTDYMVELAEDEEKIESFGPGDYEEGSMTIEPNGAEG